MEILTKDQLLLHKDRYAGKILREGAIFIHPTDTIYGLGCNALDDQAVRRLRDIKANYRRPFSIIAPSKDWIREHCHIGPGEEKWLAKLPGPYTLILRLKDPSLFPDQVTAGLSTLGVRLPSHWISGFVEFLGEPVITTSANLVGENYMTAIDDLNVGIRQHVAFTIYEGEIQGRPSALVNLTDTEEVITR